MEEIASFVNRQSRNNLLFTTKEVEGVNYVDIGRQLAEKIENHLQNKRLGMIAEDALNKMFSLGSCRNEEIGEYLAIKNIGILFEPALHIDVGTILKKWSRDHILVVMLEGEIQNGIFYLSAKATKCFVDLNDITHKIIQ